MFRVLGGNRAPPIAALRRMLAARASLLAVGACEALWGAYVFFFTQHALATVVGRHLSVGPSGALVPTLAQAAALRLALGVLIVAVTYDDDCPAAIVTKLAVAAAIHACLLQPFVAAFRTHPRMPTVGRLAFSLGEGAVLVAGMASDVDFAPSALIQQPAFVAAASSLAIGVLLALLTAVCAACAGGSAAVASSRCAAAIAYRHHPRSGASVRGRCCPQAFRHSSMAPAPPAAAAAAAASADCMPLLRGRGGGVGFRRGTFNPKSCSPSPHRASIPPGPHLAVPLPIPHRSRPWPSQHRHAKLGRRHAALIR